MRTDSVVPVVVAGVVFWLAVVPLGGCGLLDRSIPREELVEDVERLAWTIEDAHPDPYARGGGKSAFDQRLEDTIAGIPAEGMTKREFSLHLMPFMAAIGDAHTVIHADFETDWSRPGGIPLYFGAVGEELYVRGVTREDERRLIGARLVSVEGVPFEEIVERHARFRPRENEYGTLAWLGHYGDLWCGGPLAALVPEWKNRSQVTVGLRMPSRTVEIYTFALPRQVDYPPIVPEQTVTLPNTDRCDFAWSFLDAERRVAILRIDGMMRYREALEMWEAHGWRGNRDHGREAYEMYQGRSAPDDYADVIAGAPSVTEVFRELVVAMEDAGTRTLLVDLRRNDGGNSFMSNILVYFLYGRDVLLERSPGLEVKKYSEYYFEVRPEPSLADINEGRDVPLALGMRDTLSNPRHGLTPELIESRLANLGSMTTFAAELESGEYDAYYTPEHVVVLSTPWTFSSGYTMMRYLYRAGAELAGTPSGQASNCYGDILGFELPNSGLSGSVSHKAYVGYPDDPELGRVLPMDHPMTYEYLRETGFDLDAEVLWGMEVGGG